MLEKIIFDHTSNRVVTANEDAIEVYRYEVEKPVVVCQVGDERMVGWHEVVVRTMAECDEEYLKGLNLTS